MPSYPDLDEKTERVSQVKVWKPGEMLAWPYIPLPTALRPDLPEARSAQQTSSPDEPVQEFIPFSAQDWSPSAPGSNGPDSPKTSAPELERVVSSSSANGPLTVLADPLKAEAISCANQAMSDWMPPELVTQPPQQKDSPNSAEAVQESKAQVRQILRNAQAKADEIVARAETRANDLILRAEAQVSEAHQQAEAQANAISRQAYSDGLAAANAETAELLRSATSIVEEVNAWRESILSQGEMMMLRLVIEIAQTLFGDGLPLDPDTLGQAFGRALAEAKTLGNLRIYVHPDDVTALGPYWTQQQTAMSGQRIELIPSDIIKRGGCFVEGQYGSVDGRVETQLKTVKETMLTTLAETGQDSSPEGEGE